MNTPRPILIMAGGTGGHVFPGLAVAQALRAQGQPVMWLGTRRGLEARLVPEAGIEMAWIGVAGLRGKGWRTWPLAPLRLARALWQAGGVLRRLRPRAVIGFGGFVSGPGGVMAVLMRIPLFVHEQNAVAGMTNRWLARFSRRAFTGFPVALPGAAGKTAHVGNPVRAAIASLPPPQDRYSSRSGSLRLLVLGGSQGARALNRRVPETLARLDAGQRPQVRHQAGERHLEDAKQAYAQAGVTAEVMSFVADMAEAYGWADLVICRAGALTVAELAAAGVASVLVPFPYAVDDHQRVNGAHLADAGAAIMIVEQALDAERLLSVLRELGDRARLREMAMAARRLAKPRAAEAVAAACLADLRADAGGSA
ncbi:undecaprenyldiphospho-muramoylpentapeptide beta-N-acetylglucosaminyltransferase [Acidihalobacter prosperus]|uniref:UDP-N-acetylglucosamine--N-acetylmuramyl-(pentapeptide) pyrophosphoryl-undecaprenol N-acetylglucosamine transferase n=1 Tax=Acidihalobacter prosperus TaxID=160660 RepID=A0A1A6C3D6_9GAMM|nr:undecaprenyldiphospho-muramoylpentapeptide beta-N-acetylglucosaminyltransferase [Acidihalobacter prosperus]OBS09073.1 UDP-N-acetylglucosamine--N-acetylmuramyl-(pentapeptide) pyrophosphoryl-undecaprenol N-acetylglucosamine transferase [Acidihalobacter prosperus]